ncbi:LPXTG-motif protein cell wall anchor domain protein, partial [Gardnerella vaginalis JCP8481A]|uniref:BspA family leucine-rich repeat surface protein n=2 Tax=Gardnerella vaginalis TaxID=2702 RepID=UPI000352C076
WNVGNVTNMCNMFSHSLVEGADNLTDISALSGWNVSNVTDMSGMFSDCKKLTGAADLSGWDISKVTNLSSMFSNAGAESGDNFVLDFSNKTFTKSKTPVANADPDDQSKHYFSVDGMFDGFKGTLIANGWSSSGFGEDDGDNPIAKHFAKGGIFSLDENNHSDNIVITNNVTILDASSEDGTPLKKIAYYIPVKAKLMEPGDMPSCKCDDSSVPGGTAGDTTYTYYVPALYDSSNLERQQNEKSQDYAYRIVKNSFASKFRSAIDSQSGKEPGGDDTGDDTGDGTGDDTGDEVPGGNSRSARLKSRVKKLRSARESRSVKGDDDEVENPDEVPELPEEEQGNTYKIMFKKSSEGGCTWTELGNGDDNVPDNPKSPLIFFNTLYYLETFVKPVPLPHTGGQSAVMFTFLSIGLFSMFAVAGAFGRHGWVASVLSGTALTGFAKGFSCGVLDIAYGFKHCFAHSVAHSVVSGSMLKSAVSAATGFFARFRSNESTFGKHTKQR